MGKLGEMLYKIYVGACGYPHGSRGKDFGFAQFARAMSGVMDAAKCADMFDMLFEQAATAARRRRTRLDAAAVDWCALVERVELRKFQQLLGRTESEDTARRIYKEQGGASRQKSPRREGADDGGEGGDDRPSKRPSGAAERKAKSEKRAGADDPAKRKKDVADALRIEKEMSATTISAGATGGASKGSPKWDVADVTAALTKLGLDDADYVVSSFAKARAGDTTATAAQLFNEGVKLCMPDMPWSDAPCFFKWMSKKGCGAPPPGKPACGNCKRAAELGKAAVKPPPQLMEAIKAHANESTAALLSE
jgi:hypothetical protein